MMKNISAFGGSAIGRKLFSLTLCRRLPAIALATAGAFCLCAFLSACAHLTVKTPTWSMSANSFCKDIQIPKVNVSNNISNGVSNNASNSDITVEGYNSTVNAIALQAATDQIISTIIRQGIKAYLP